MITVHTVGVFLDTVKLLTENFQEALSSSTVAFSVGGVHHLNRHDATYTTRSFKVQNQP